MDEKEAFGLLDQKGSLPESEKKQSQRQSRTLKLSDTAAVHLYETPELALEESQKRVQSLKAPKPDI